MPRNAKHKLQFVTCKNASAKDKPHRLYFGHGLYLETLPSGTKTFYSKYRFAGREKRVSLGSFPAITPELALAKHLVVKRLLADNIDPAVVKREAKKQAELAARNTFKAVASEWFETISARWSRRHQNQVKRNLEKDVYPRIGNMPIQQITSPEIIKLLQAVESRGVGETVRRVMSICSSVFVYAKVKGWVSSNPTEGVSMMLQPVAKKHFAAISLEELPDFLRKLKEDTGTSDVVKKATILLMLTFVRTNELIGMRWDEVNFAKATWTIGAERMKGRRHEKRAHIVPLSTQALKILEELKANSKSSEFVFAGRNSWKKPMSNMAILQCLRRLGYANKMTGHGFRALAKSTIMEKLGYREEVPDRQLAHIPATKYRGAYDRSEFLPDRIKMMQDWANLIDELTHNIAKG